MTANQISYLRYLEDARSNRAREDETERANLAKEELQRKSNEISEERASVQNALDTARKEDQKLDTLLSRIESGDPKAITEYQNEYGDSLASKLAMGTGVAFKNVTKTISDILGPATKILNKV